MLRNGVLNVLINNELSYEYQARLWTYANVHLIIPPRPAACECYISAVDRLCVTLS